MIVQLAAMETGLALPQGPMQQQRPPCVDGAGAGAAGAADEADLAPLEGAEAPELPTPAGAAGAGAALSSDSSPSSSISFTPFSCACRCSVKVCLAHKADQ